jgi:hAT family C-terminal dimerisation region
MAEATIVFLLDELTRQNTELSSKFYNSILHRITSRRNAVLVDLLLYLKNPDYIPGHNHYKQTPKTTIHKLGIELIQQHFLDYSSGNEASTSNDIPIHTNSEGSIRERLKLSIKKYSTLTTDDSAIPDNLKREFLWFERNKKRPRIMDQLFLALSTIQPTSTQSERNFSVSSNILTKQRNQLLDKNLNAMYLLKVIFSII